MSLIKCTECGHQVSTNARQCPSCGSKKFKPTSRIHLAFAAILLILVVKCSMDKMDQPPPPQAAAKTPEQIKIDAQREAEFQDAVRKVRALKSTLKNPSSFELVQAMRTENGTLCLSYRGSNSFNATVLEQKAIGPDSKVVNYATACAGKQGTSMTHVRQAL